jgi:hypothetical protein
MLNQSDGIAVDTSGVYVISDGSTSTRAATSFCYDDPSSAPNAGPGVVGEPVR